jgi:hypothetical protein
MCMQKRECNTLYVHNWHNCKCFQHIGIPSAQHVTSIPVVCAAYTGLHVHWTRQQREALHPCCMVVQRYMSVLYHVIIRHTIEFAQH